MAVPPPPGSGASGHTDPPVSFPPVGDPHKHGGVLPNPNPNLGFTPSLNSDGSSSQPSSSQSAAVKDTNPRLLCPDGTSPVGGNGSSLGLQPPSSIQPRRYPKVSTNFNAPEGSRQPQGNNNTAQDHSKALQPPAPTPTNKQATAPMGKAANKPSFAEAAARKAAKPPDLFTHNLNSVQPIKMMDGLTVIMPEAMYEKSLKTYQHALIGRLLLPQGAAPHSVEQLKGELASIFDTTGDWSLMPLGKGFFSLKFLLHEDHLKAARQSSWKLAVGFLQIRAWKPNFDPYKELS